MEAITYTAARQNLAKTGSSRINVIFLLFENQHFIYLRLSMVITTWIYSNFTEISVVVPPNP
jgi:hypothetical protein